MGFINGPKPASSLRSHYGYSNWKFAALGEIVARLAVTHAILDDLSACELPMPKSEDSTMAAAQGIRTAQEIICRNTHKFSRNILFAIAIDRRPSTIFSIAECREAIQLARTIGPERNRQALRGHIDAMLVGTFGFILVMEGLPLALIGSGYSVTPPTMRAAASLLCSAWVAVVAPHEWLAPVDASLGDLPEPTFEETCSWIDYLFTYARVSSLVRGGDGEITLDRLDKLPSAYNPELWRRRFSETRKTHTTMPRALVSLLWAQLLLCTTLGVLFAAAQLVSPMGLYCLLDYMQHPDEAIFQPWLWLLVICGGRITQTAFHQAYSSHSRKLAAQVNAMLTAEVFHSALASRELHGNFNGLDVVTGTSGSGKTSLLLALLGETHKKSGSVVRQKDAAYSSQTPWLQAGTIQENILFYNAYDENGYRKVVDACCLTVDFEEMEHGDQTVIGSGTVALPGGQQARNTWIADEANVVIVMDHGRVQSVSRREKHVRKAKPIQKIAVSRELPAEPRTYIPTDENAHNEETEAVVADQERPVTGSVTSLLVVTCFLHTGAGIYTNYWLSRWVGRADGSESSILYYLMVYIGLSYLTEAIDGIRMMAFSRGIMVAAGSLHVDVINAVMAAPLSWFTEQAISETLNTSLALYQRGALSAGLAGFCLSQATQLSDKVLATIFSFNSLSLDMQIFQRVRGYTKLAREKDCTTESSKRLPASWPRTGSVELQNVTVRYTPTGQDILKNISLKIEPGERIAIVGRTGSGKSTLILSLLGFTHIETGKIFYDGVDLKSIPRRRLRQSISKIPQEPQLFQGTIASNLDPSGTIPEPELQKALGICQSLLQSTDQLEKSKIACADSSVNRAFTERLSLSTMVKSKGENFSHGQRQVLSLCRVLIRHSKLVLLDEATSSMDAGTDTGVQRALRQELLRAGGEKRALVTVAHRLQTIMNYGRVVVMGSGTILEVGSPKHLLAKKGVFYDMVKHSEEKHTVSD
ncbi:hypothetical protein MY8738_003852 [Beauveria namnaoensis]